MRREDFFTGEALPSASPLISETEAIQNASFGKYDYDPAARMMSQPLSIYPGGYGYNQPQMYDYNPYNNYNGYCNPAFAYQQQIYQQQIYQQQMQMQQEVQCYVPGVNLSGSEYLPSMNYEEEIEKLKLEYWNKEQETAAKIAVDNQGMGYNPFTGYSNYYGMPYYNPYQYNTLNSEISQKIQEIQNQAKENRMNLNLHLSTLAHNIAGDRYDESAIKEIYTGKMVDVPGANHLTYAEIYERQRFNNLVPFDNSQMYRDHSARVSNEYNSVIPKDSNLKDTFANMGVLNAKYAMEEEAHRRKDKSVLYNSEDNSYKFFVRAKAAERYAKNNGLSLTQAVQQYDHANLLCNMPTLSQSAKLCDDGTLNITCNFGSMAGQTYSVHNSQEAGYEQNRERFQQFLDSIPGSIYLDGPSASVLED